MCLYSKQDWCVANSDIKCYKTLELKKKFLGIKKYYTPYRGMEVSRKIISGKKDLIAEGEPFLSSVMRGNNDIFHVVEGGVIHAYVGYKDAYPDKYFHPLVRIEIFECIIPTGTKFMVGIDGDICAEKIRFVKKIENNSKLWNGIM